MNIDPDILPAMEDELAATITAYQTLLDQIEKLAIAMNYRSDYVLIQVMPKKSCERTDTIRIKDWFYKERDHAAEHMQVKRDNIQRDKDRQKLLKSLGLTKEQQTLLGIPK